MAEKSHREAIMAQIAQQCTFADNPLIRFKVGAIPLPVYLALAAVVFLSAYGHMELMPFAQIATRIGGACVVVLAIILLRLTQ